MPPLAAASAPPAPRPDLPRRYHALFLSDLHLGSRHSQTEGVLRFLREHDAAHLYLVGDIFDGWALRRAWHWDQSINDIIQKLLRKARKGTRITYIPGNHDAFAKAFSGQTMGRIRIADHAIHVTPEGRQLLVIHGDQFDGVVLKAQWLYRLGGVAYEWALRMNRWMNRYRRWRGLPYWSLSAYLKYKTKRAVQHIGDFESIVVREAERCEVDGVVCGHIHHAELTRLGGMIYANTGDWVESCTALAEHIDGRLELLRWTHEGDRLASLFLDELTEAEPLPPISGDGQESATPEVAVAQALA